MSSVRETWQAIGRALNERSAEVQAKVAAEPGDPIAAAYAQGYTDALDTMADAFTDAVAELPDEEAQG